MFIFLDESGDLGFDFSKSKTSPTFTIALLVCDDKKTVLYIQKAVKHTLKNKVNRKRGKRRIVHELKGQSTSDQIKEFLLKKLPTSGWKLYAISINKRNVQPSLQSKKGKKKLYNYLTKELLKTLPPNLAPTTVNLVVDKSKDHEDRKDFNAYIRSNFETAFPLETNLYITHEDSQENTGIQAIDIFCWMIQKSESMGDHFWYDRISDHIAKHVKYFQSKENRGARAA